MSAQAQENWSRSETVTPDLDKSLFHYLFLPVDLSAGKVPGGGLDISHTVMNTGLRIIPRGRITLVKDKAWTNPRAPLGGDGAEVGDDEREIGQPFTVGKRVEVAHAQDIAYGLASRTYQDSGLIVIGRLTGIHEPVVRWVEAVLLPQRIDSILGLHQHLANWDIADMPQFPEGDLWRGWRLSTGIVPEELVQSVRRELLTSCATGEQFVRSFYSDQQSEMRQAMIPGGKGGLSRVTDKLRLFAGELGLEPPENLAQQAQQVRANYEAAAPATLQLPSELTDMFKALLAQGFKITPPASVQDASPASENWANTSEPAPQTAPQIAESDDSTPTAKLEEPGQTVGQKAAAEAPFAARCGAPKADGSPCKQNAGHGTDHPGKGRCVSHEGS